MSNRDRDAKKISSRRWDEIRTAWQDYIPNHDSPWPVPEHELHELSSLSSELRAFGGDRKRDIKAETIEHEIYGLRAAVLHESTVLIHKASHVLRAMDEEASQGYRTWSRSSAYHSAFFAMRGLLGLLGIVVVTPPDSLKNVFQIDIWAPRQRKSHSPSDSNFAIRIMPRGPVQHKQMWSIFHRLLCASKVEQEIWPYAGNDVLKQLDSSDFSSVRHRLHYRSNGWIYDDLSDTSHLEVLDNLAEDVVQLRYLGNPEDGQFPLSFGLHLLSLGISLLTDLGREAKKVGDEVDRVKVWMQSSAWGCANAFERRV